MGSESLDASFGNAGYRVFGEIAAGVRVYYRYVREGFCAVLAVDLDRRADWTAAEQGRAVEYLKGFLYHPSGFPSGNPDEAPQSVLADFPDGFPVYHVDVLTLLCGRRQEKIRQLCAQCEDTWGYLAGSGRLLVYENQPGDFWGLRAVLESLESGIAAPRKAQFGALPFVTVGLIAANVIVFLAMLLFGDAAPGELVLIWGGIYPPLVAERHQWWRLLAAGFLHFGAEHLANNMLILYCMGERLEHAVGHGRFLVIYAASLLGGSLLSCCVMIATGNYALAAGASNAVYGVIGGVLWIVLKHHGHYAGISTRRMLFMLCLTVYYGFTSAGIDGWGHLGGAAAGFVATILCTAFIK